MRKFLWWSNAQNYHLFQR